MNEFLNLEVLIKTFQDLPIGIGIFRVHDLNDIKSIQYVYMNNVILYEMRKTSDEVVGKKIIEVAPEAYEHEGGRFVIETYRKVASEGGSINLGLVKYSNHMVAGTYECSVHHIMDNYIYVMLRNVTELEESKNKLEQKNEELNQFTSIVSHDLKEPLNTISGIIDLIQDEYHDKLDDQAKTLFKYLTDTAARMRNVISNLLDYTNLGHGHDMVTVDCKELVQSVLQDLDARIKTTNASIHFGDLPKIKGYETELRLLFQNFISNSIKFSRPGINPIIKISAKAEGDWVFSIEDNGIGISDENKDKIFNIFQRLHTREEYEGSGIGLAHCKKIVALHKGTLWLDSKVGEGSTFYFTIPNSTTEN